jgi:hypothetical protein
LLALSSIDYGLIALVAFASSFFGAFGKELADFLVRYVRKGLGRQNFVVS